MSIIGVNIITIFADVEKAPDQASQDGNDYLLLLIIIYPLRHIFKAQARW